MSLTVSHESVWRVSSDGADIQRWLPKSSSDTFGLYTLSVTSLRLPVTSRSDRQPKQAATNSYKLRLPSYVEPLHAMVSPTGTFIVSHRKTKLIQWQVSEVNTEVQVPHQFSGSSLGWPAHTAVDSQGNIIVADSDNCRILLLDAKLALCRVIGGAACWCTH